MNQRVYQVWLNYLLHWPVRLVGVFYLLVCSVAVFLGGFSATYSRNVSPAMPYPPPMEMVSSRLFFEQEGRNARSLNWNVEQFGAKAIATSEPLPKLISLQVYGSFKSSDQLQILRSMPNLEAFSLMGELPADSLKYFAELKRLRFLRLLSVEKNPDLKPLRGLTELQLLDIISVQNYEQLFEEIRLIPSLQTLVLPGQIIAAFKPSDWERLRSLPHLRRLYLRGDPWSFDTRRMELDRVQQILPNVTIRPNEVSERRRFVWCYIVLAGMLVWGVVSSKLASQFSEAGSCVTPHYATSHLQVAVTLLACTTVLHTVILWGSGCSFSASLAGSLVFPGLCWWLNLASLRSVQKEKISGTLNLVFSACMCLQAFVFAIFGSGAFLSDFDWFLAGRQPLLAWVIVAISLTSPVLVLRRIGRLHLMLQESSAGVQSLGAPGKNWTILGNPIAVPPDGPWNARYRNHQSHALEVALATTNSGNRSRLFCAANGVDVMRVALRTAMVVACIFCGSQLWSWSGFNMGPPPQILLMVVVMSWIWSGMVFLGLAVLWLGRKPILAVELLRPASRADFVRQLFGSVSRDLAPLLVCQTLAIAILAITAVLTRELPPLFLPAVASYCVFRGLSSYTAILYLLTIRTGWFVITSVGVIFLLDYISFACLLATVLIPESWVDLSAILICLIGSLVMATGLYWLKGYWQRIELA